MRRPLLVLLASLFVVLAACDGASDDALPARLRVVHAAEPASVACYEDAALLTRIAYGATSPYLSVEPGTTLLEARTDDFGVQATEQVLLRADSAYTAVVAGPPDALALLLVEETAASLAGDVAFVRLVHAASRTGAIAALLDAEADDGPSAVLASGLRYGDVAPALTLDAGSYDLLVDEVGGAGDVRQPLRLEAGGRYLLVVTDARRATTLDVIVAD